VDPINPKITIRTDTRIFCMVEILIKRISAFVLIVHLDRLGETTLKKMTTAVWAFKFKLFAQLISSDKNDNAVCTRRMCNKRLGGLND
jgi:hypothetical protein